MEHQRETAERRPAEALRDILTRWRDRELASTDQAARDETADAAISPGDEMDLANSILEREMRASLDERHQERLNAIGAAFERLREGLYGVCEQCGEEIAMERLTVLPFAINCIDCQTERETRVRRTIGDERRVAPLQIDELLETERSSERADSDADIPVGSALDPEQNELKTTRKSARQRGQKQEPALAHARLEDRSKVTGGTRSAFVETGKPAARPADNQGRGIPVKCREKAQARTQSRKHQR
jgi:RNA polymerase-binding transcription factor